MARKKSSSGKKRRSGRVDTTQWIQGANLNEGSFTAKAKAAGKSVGEYAAEKKNAKGKLGKQARLALTFRKMARRKKGGKK